MIRVVLVSLALLIGFGSSIDAQELSRKEKRKKKNIVIEYRVDTVYVVDTLVQYIEKVSTADTLFRFSDITEEDVNRYDSLVNELYKQNTLKELENITSIAYATDSLTIDSKVRSIPDSVLMKRFDNMHTAIELPYHPIMKKFIAKYIDNPKFMNILLSRSMLYMPLFEQTLLENNMPTEIKILPIVESALDPAAVSYMGAGGLWQFMPATGKMYGLRISSLVDERLDALKSTEAACKYLTDLNKIYDNWILALAAYNCGPGNVNKAMKRAKNSSSYWDIYPHLPSQTRDYIPLFIAANYAFTFYKSHGIELTNKPEGIIVEPVTIGNRVLDFRQISSTINVDESTLKALNPQFRRGIVPATTADMTIYLPSECVLAYYENEEEIFAKEKEYIKNRESIIKMDLTPSVHIVRSGDVLGSIARRYRTSVATLMRLNGMKNANKLRVGQKLIVS